MTIINARPARLLPPISVLAVLAVACGPAPAPAKKAPADPRPPAPASLPAVEYPRVMVDENPDPKVVEVRLEARRAPVELAPGHVVDAWTYDGGVPGPLLQARVGDRVIVHFTNRLEEATTVHWHGLRISDRMDGVPHMQAPVQPGETFTYEFVPPEAGSFWYHPHMRSHEQVERGLYGPIVIHEAAADVPDFDVDRYFVLDDVRLDASGGIAPPSGGHMDTMHGRYGDTLVVNGLTEPVPFEYRRNHVERWRLVNTANARTLSLGVEGAVVRIIGVDGGLLAEPFEERRFTLPVGARVELEVRYTEDAAALSTWIPYVDENDRLREEKIPFIRGLSMATLPLDGNRAIRYPPVAAPPAPEALEVTKTLAFSGHDSPDGIVFTINGKAWPDMDEWSVTQGEPQVVALVNELGMEHPFHLHGQFFQVLTRNGRPAGEPGWRDTVLLEGGDTVVIATRFENAGEWMYHCHIHEHSEAGMMSLVHVAPSP